VNELEQEVEVLEGELSAAQDAAKKAPSRTLRALVERLRNQLAIKEKQQRVSLALVLSYMASFSHSLGGGGEAKAKKVFVLRIRETNTNFGGCRCI